MRKILTCEFSMDTACVELKYSDGSMVSIDTIAVENEVANNMYERSELDYLIYNDSVAYAGLILNGDSEKYLKMDAGGLFLLNFLFQISEQLRIEEILNVIS